MAAATLLVLVSVDIDPLDVDADEAARGAIDAEDRIKRALEKRRLVVGAQTSVLVPVPMQQISAALGAFAESVEKRDG